MPVWNGHEEKVEFDQGSKVMVSKRTYPREFKLQAVELVNSNDKSTSEIECELRITSSLLTKWKQRLKVDGQQAFLGKRRLKEDEELIRRLQR